MLLHTCLIRIIRIQKSNLKFFFRSCYEIRAAALATLLCTATTTGTPFTTAAGLIGFNGNLTALAVQQALLTGRKRREATKETPNSKIRDQPMLSYQGYIDATKVLSLKLPIYRTILILNELT